ncbi:hypothetical protein ACIBCE_40900, partial [Streptomyces sp. NPDC051554]
MDHNSLRKLVEGQLLRLEGNTFQDCMDRLGLELYPGDYQPVRAAGPQGGFKVLNLIDLCRSRPCDGVSVTRHVRNEAP